MIVKVFENLLDICFRCLMGGYIYHFELCDVGRYFINSSWAVLGTDRHVTKYSVDFSEG